MLLRNCRSVESVSSKRSNCFSIELRKFRPFLVVTKGENKKKMKRENKKKKKMKKKGNTHIRLVLLVKKKLKNCHSSDAH